ncbi:Mitogen-activated protein kinase HOG1 [Penicillium subrubescens]|uniref:Mitogen-activated protein kinase HOG1 n=1 Tax=Penicillium subrubescens TaxID=1316194 RepID=A0A1Q5TMM7_9EURO|nr:Mitogen-activated protein kinase HOG1 [Penicillium subrubescens]
MARNIFREIKLLRFLKHENRGLKYIHSAGIFHCDLKPSNILVDRNCDLKICNIVYAELKPWTANDVSTKYYKAPEAIIERHICDEYIDIWGAGCIFAELLHGKVLFPGQNSIHQLHVITKPLGTPSEIAINSMFSKNVRI